MGCIHALRKMFPGAVRTQDCPSVGAREEGVNRRSPGGRRAQAVHQWWEILWKTQSARFPATVRCQACNYRSVVHLGPGSRWNAPRDVL